MYRLLQVVGQILDHRRGTGDLLEVPVVEALGQGDAHGLARLDEPLAAVRSDRDQLGPPVVRVGAPPDQVEPRQRGQLPADHRAIDVQRRGDLTGPDAAARIEHPERDQVTRSTVRQPLLSPPTATSAPG